MNMGTKQSVFGHVLSALLFGFLLFPALAKAENIEVCPSCPISSIKKAVEMADEGALIRVSPGIYKEHDILIDKPLSLLGTHEAIIDGESKGEVISVTADGVTVDGFRIINVGSSRLKDFAAIRAKRVENFTFQNLLIEKPFFAIFSEKSKNGAILNNRVYGNATNEFNAGNGIHIWYSKGLRIEGNEVEAMRDGIYLEFSDDNEIHRNRIRKNVRYGLHFMFSQNNKVSESLYEQNGAGIAIMFSKKMLMYKNHFFNNWGPTAFSLLLKEAADCHVFQNNFDTNTIGISVEGSNRVHFEYNDFKSNGWAVRSRGANYDNVFEKNNFMNNAFDLSYEGQANNNSFDGNYWQEYAGYDLDRDGIGDVPHTPINIFSYVVNKSPEAIILLRSPFVSLVNFAEKLSPNLNQQHLQDKRPLMKKVSHD